jgi:hypothetical protein
MRCEMEIRELELTSVCLLKSISPHGSAIVQKFLTLNRGYMLYK